MITRFKIGLLLLSLSFQVFADAPISRKNIIINPQIQDYVAVPLETDANNKQWNYHYSGTVSAFSMYGTFVGGTLWINHHLVTPDEKNHFEVPYTIDDHLDLQINSNNPENVQLDIPNLYLNEQQVGFKDYSPQVVSLYNWTCDGSHPRGSRSIVQMTIYGSTNSYSCTGTLVNNQRFDGTPYVLTADHCGVVTGQAVSSLTVNATFQRQTPCGTALNAYSNEAVVMTGGTTVSAGNNDFNGASVSGDYWLLQFPQIPVGANPSFAGLNFNPSTSDIVNAYSISHAYGANKSYALFNGTNHGSVSYDGRLTWTVLFDVGEILDGSSGGGVFDNQERLFGILSRKDQDATGNANYYLNLASAGNLKSILSPSYNQISGTTVARTDNFDFYLSAELTNSTTAKIEYYANNVLSCTAKNGLMSYPVTINTGSWISFTTPNLGTIVMTCNNGLGFNEQKSIDLTQITYPAAVVAPNNQSQNNSGGSSSSKGGGAMGWGMSLLFSLSALLRRKTKI